MTSCNYNIVITLSSCSKDFWLCVRTGFLGKLVVLCCEKASLLNYSWFFLCRPSPQRTLGYLLVKLFSSANAYGNLVKGACARQYLVGGITGLKVQNL